MAFPLINTWAPGDELTSAQINTVATDLVNALDKTGDGSGSSPAGGISGTVDTISGGVQRFLSGSNLQTLDGSTTTVSGKLLLSTRTINSNYIVDSSGNDNVIFADSSGGSLSITLPTAVAGRRLIVIDSGGGASSHTIEVQTPGGGVTISGSSARQIVQDYGAMEIVSDGSDWFVTASYKTLA